MKIAMNPHPSFDVNLHNASFQRLDGSNFGSKTGASGAVESCSQHHDAARNCFSRGLRRGLHWRRRESNCWLNASVSLAHSNYFGGEPLLVFSASAEVLKPADSSNAQRSPKGCTV